MFPVVLGTFWNDDTADRLRLIMALAGLSILAWGYWLKQEGRPREQLRLRASAFLLLGILGGIAYPNFGNLHFGNFIHTWDTYHYYLGAKYFPELGYERLYECTVVADGESGLGDKARRRAITDLRTNVMVTTHEILDHPDRCKQHFSPERWAAFKRDVAWFRNRCNDKRWEQIQHDHGYNATPVWTVAGYFFANLTSATDVQVTLLNLLDPLYLLLMAAMLWWAFGWRGFAIGLLWFGTNYANRYYWTGGAYLRHDWLFYLVASVCLLKKERYYLAGGAIAYATLLRLFPGLLIVGPFLALVDLAWRERRLDRRYLKFFVGGAGATAVLVALSLVVTGGFQSYVSFAHNTSKHAATPLTNHMGLRTVLSYRPTTTGANLRDGRLIDPWSVWKQTRLDNFGKLKPLFYALLLGFTVLLYFAVRGAGHEPWVAAALSTALIAATAELTNYYYCFVIAVAVLHEKRREVGMMLLALSAVTQLIGWAPLSTMSKWEDEKYTAMSVASLIALAGVMWLFTPRVAAAGALAADPAPVELKSNALPGKKRKRR